MRSHAARIVLALAFIGFARNAHADGGPAASTTAYDGGYAYAFYDDLMTADASWAAAPRVAVASHVVRTVLIRPRTNFVPQLLKSVENL
jgi:hypothetical protein